MLTNGQCGQLAGNVGRLPALIRADELHALLLQRHCVCHTHVSEPTHTHTHTHTTRALPILLGACGVSSSSSCPVSENAESRSHRCAASELCASVVRTGGYFLKRA